MWRTTPADEGRYRIQTVAAMTGVAAPTLRSWERRYGVPAPRRTASSYRLYSDHDVAQVQRLRDLCASGLGVAEAARQLQQEQEARVERAPPDPMALAADTLVQNARDFDVAATQLTLQRIQSMGPACRIYERILRPAMIQIGSLCADGSMSVSQEHFVTNLVETLLRDLLRLVQPMDPERHALLACFADETHTLGLYGVGLRLAGWGFGVVSLGARLPPEALAQAVARLQPDVVGLSVVSPVPPAQAKTLVPAYAKACADTVWMVGGPGVASVATLARARRALVAEDDLAALRPELERALLHRRRARE